jgi:hypothetical protein
LRVEQSADTIRIDADTYALELPRSRPFVVVRGADGSLLARLNPIAAVDATDAPDATASIGEPAVDDRSDEVGLSLPVESASWRSKRAVVVCRPDELALAVEVEGVGALDEVRLLGGWYPTDARWPAAWYRSRIEARSVVSAAPADPSRIVLDPNEGARLGVSGGGQPGRGSWFFAPPPFVLAFGRSDAARRDVVPDGPWTSVAIRAAPGEETFSEVEYVPLDGAFHLRLAYDGQTRVGGRWRSPEAVLRFGLRDPYAAIAAETSRASAPRRSALPQADPADGPSWWRQPMFCGWGAQSADARAAGAPGRAATWSTEEAYERYLGRLEAEAIVPGTIVIDDKWQRAYGIAQPDAERWPDLARWIGARHDRGQHVLLWWKAWDVEAIPPEWCVRTVSGRPVAADPSNPEYRSFLGQEITRLVADPPAGLGADGIKIDFTAQTPAAPGLVHHGPEWGVELLHLLLATIHDAAKAARPDAFVVAHAPNARFADCADAVRLNDLLRLDDPEPLVPIVAQMRHRAAIARAACPGLLIETDDWAVPSRDDWRAYLAVKADLGIPSLYYADRLDPSGEPLRDEDYAAVRDVWAGWRDRHGLASPERARQRARA